MAELNYPNYLKVSQYNVGFNKNFTCAQVDESFFNNLDNKETSLFLLNLNIQGLLPKKDSLFALVKNLAANYKLPDIICLQETWL